MRPSMRNRIVVAILNRLEDEDFFRGIVEIVTEGAIEEEDIGDDESTQTPVADILKEVCQTVEHLRHQPAEMLPASLLAEQLIKEAREHQPTMPKPILKDRIGDTLGEGWPGIQTLMNDVWEEVQRQLA